jgi:hypothetical protein
LENGCVCFPVNHAAPPIVGGAGAAPTTICEMMAAKRARSVKLSRWVVLWLHVSFLQRLGAAEIRRRP